jgi:hypothetical protein
MQYLLLIYSNGATENFETMSEADRNAIVGEYFAISDEPGTLGGAQLQPAETATTVRVEDGRTLTTDGPFAESKEVLGGYYLIESDDLDGALVVAGRIPAARLGGAIEVRPLVER